MVLRPLEEKRSFLERRTDEPSTATRAVRSRDATAVGYRGPRRDGSYGARAEVLGRLGARVERRVERVADEGQADEDDDEHEAGKDPGPPAEPGGRRVVREAELELDDVGDEVPE